MRLTVYFFAFLLFCGCGGDDDSNGTLVLPSNLQIAVDVSDDGSGKVDVTASADNANFYTIYFDLGAGEIPKKSSNGEVTYTYAESGTYTIRVRAHATDTDFIEESEEVTILLDDPDDIPIPSTGYSTPTSYAGMNLVWQDEFEGSSLNTDNWTFEIGTGASGWGNNELQYYRSQNTSFQDGNLIITAKEEEFSGSDYTSSRIITKDKKSFQYGRIDIRAVLPKGQGIWPALWMLGANIETVPWPACGEIDIMEMVGGTTGDKTVYGTLHWDDNGRKCTCDKPGYVLSSGTFNDKYHVFTMTWDANFITWFVDDVQFNKIDITPAALSELKNPHFFIMNLAVGGNWPGSPNSSTVFPQYLIVDYIRVFQNN
ncbi:MAG TPA: family 16 glycosylhydrolase [Ohtaekwangia sp.]